MDGDKPIGRVLDVLSLCINREEGYLCKHGEPDSVAQWYGRELAKLQKSGCTEMANALVVLTGRFPVEEINRCLTNANYVGEFYRKLISGEISELPLFEDIVPGRTAPGVVLDGGILQGKHS